MQRLKSFLSDGFWLYLFPASAALMPWAIYFRICGRLTRVRHPYRQAIETELRYAQTLLPSLDPERFRHEQALVKFVDAADFYLGMTRTHRWFRRHVSVEGAWPAAGRPAILMGSHWGAAHWIWRDLEHHDIRAWFVARKSGATDFGRGRLAGWYGRFRGWGMRRAGSRGVITTGGAIARIATALENNDAIVALNDVPTGSDHSSALAQLLGRSVQLSTRLLELAKTQQGNVCFFSMAFDLASGHRTLRIRPIDNDARVDSIIRDYGAFVDELISKRPGSWQIWAIAPQLLSLPTPDAS